VRQTFAIQGRGLIPFDAGNIQYARVLLWVSLRRIFASLALDDIIASVVPGGNGGYAWQGH
jgi:hypothetical protein